MGIIEVLRGVKFAAKTVWEMATIGFGSVLLATVLFLLSFVSLLNVTVMAEGPHWILKLMFLSSTTASVAAYFYVSAGGSTKAFKPTNEHCEYCEEHEIRTMLLAFLMLVPMGLARWMLLDLVFMISRLEGFLPIVWVGFILVIFVCGLSQTGAIYRAAGGILLLTTIATFFPEDRANRTAFVLAGMISAVLYAYFGVLAMKRRRFIFYQATSDAKSHYART